MQPSTVSPIQRKLINTLQDKEELVSFFLIKQVKFDKTQPKPNKPSADYMDLVLMDDTGEIPAKLWDLKPGEREIFEQINQPLTIVKVQAETSTFKGQLQLRIIQIRQARKEDGFTEMDFIKSAPIRPIEEMAYLKKRIASIRDPLWRGITQFCYERAEEKLLHYPAAKTHHHAYYAGLLFHLVLGLDAVDFYCRQRPFLNEDLLTAGWLIHDIGKVEEMIAELGVVSDYSRRGKLMGHICIATVWITEAAIKLGFDLYDERLEALYHLVLSHHGKGEHGSPVDPQTPEAIALHNIDMQDSRLQCAEDAFMDLKPGEEWTSKIRMFNNHQLYRLPMTAGGEL